MCAVALKSAASSGSVEGITWRSTDGRRDGGARADRAVDNPSGSSRAAHDYPSPKQQGARRWPCTAQGVCAELGRRSRAQKATQQRRRACVLELAALGARGRKPVCWRLATRGAHLLDRRLELRREVHGRHELIERKALRGRHGLVPGQPRRGTGLSVGHASAQASARLRCGGGREELLGCKYGTAPLVPASRSTEARSVESNWLKQTESADMRAAAVTATTALYLVPTAQRGPTRRRTQRGLAGRACGEVPGALRQ